jgi:hypothetical protein
VPKAESAGAALEQTIREALPPGVELDEREEALLSAAAHQADAIAALEKDIDARGHVVDSARGGKVLNPAVPEARQGRLALGRLLGGLDLPHSRSLTGLRASKAATARWQGREAS